MKKKAKSKQKPYSNYINNCVFEGVHWDVTAVQSVQTVAEGLVENAKALGALAGLFKSQNIHIDSLLSIKDSENELKQ